MKYVEAVMEYNQHNEDVSLFLAGGITNCPNWQQDLREQLDLEDTNFILYNPRRDNFPIEDPNASYEQIEWEYRYLRKADMISFWFCKETICPIVLYELGTWTPSRKKIFIGMDKDYSRRQDVEIQTKLVRGEDFEFVYSLEALADQIKTFLKYRKKVENKFSEVWGEDFLKQVKYRNRQERYWKGLNLDLLKKMIEEKELGKKIRWIT
jgi:hypothetical protein